MTIAIIGILTAAVMGALEMSRQSANEAKTKATIAKLNGIIMQRYESYMTRRVGFDTTAMTPTQIQAARANPKVAASYRLDAIRDLMRMEMPDCLVDVTTGPIGFTWGNVPEPALHKRYAANPPSASFDSAQCLYLAVSMGSPEAMEQFQESEIGLVDGTHRVFVDAWGTPIAWLRWAPGFNMPNSDIQSGDASTDSDPFDPLRLNFDPANPKLKGFQLIPLICSAGPNKTFGLTDLDSATPGSPPTRTIQLYTSNTINPFLDLTLGVPATGTTAGMHFDNITNHHIEQR